MEQILGAIPLSDIMEAASMRRQREQPPLPQPEAAALTLRERWAELNTEHAMRAGDVVIYKVGFDPRRRHLINQPLLLLGDNPDDYDAEALGPAIGRGDTLIAYLHADGTAILVRSDRRFLEPWPRAGGDPVLPIEEPEDPGQGSPFGDQG